MTRSSSGPFNAPLSDPDRLVIYLSVLLALFLAALDQTIVATALPRMVEDLMGVERYAWVATAYLLASTAMALVYGKLADTYPRKHVTLVAVGLFLGGSFLCGLAGEFGSLPVLGDGMTQLVVFRGIQGVGGGGIFAMTFIVIADLFTPAERGKYQAYVGAVFGVASVLGPVVGGLLTDHAGGLVPGIEGWRWVFYVNLPFGGLALWFVVRRMPRLEPPGDRGFPDLLGGALLVTGLVPVVLALQLDKRRFPWLPVGSAPGVTTAEAWTTLALLVGGTALLGAFVWRSRVSRSPILDLRLFENEVFRRANASTFFFGAAFISVTVFLPLFLVNVAGVSATGAGMALIPFSFGIVFSATLSGQLVNRVGYRPQILVGATIFFLSALLLAGMDSSTRYAEVTAFMVLAGLGVGPSLPLFTLAVQNAVDVRVIGQATSASQFFRQTGATIGAAFMGTILATTLGMSFAQLELPVEVLGPGVTAEDFLSTGGAGLPDRIREGFATMAAGEGREALLAEGERVAADIDRQLKEAFSAATRRIYGVTALLIAFAALLAWRIPELPLRTTHDREEVGS